MNGAYAKMSERAHPKRREYMVLDIPLKVLGRVITMRHRTKQDHFSLQGRRGAEEPKRQIKPFQN